MKVEKGERWNFLGSIHKTDNSKKDQEAVNTNGCRLTVRSNWRDLPSLVAVDGSSCPALKQGSTAPSPAPPPSASAQDWSIKES